MHAPARDPRRLKLSATADANPLVLPPGRRDTTLEAAGQLDSARLGFAAEEARLGALTQTLVEPVDAIMVFADPAIPATVGDESTPSYALA